MKKNKKLRQISTFVITASEMNRKLELHFNLWESRANNIHCLDIGVLCPIDEEKKDYDVFIRVPGIYKNEKIINLGSVLGEKKDVVSNVFNGIVSLDVKDEYTIITREEKPDDPFYLELGSPEVSEEQDGTKITLHVPKDQYGKAKKRYFRYRIENFGISLISDFETSKASFFLPSKEKYTVIDLRINDYKLLDYNDGKKIRDNKISFNKVHLFLINDIGETVNSNGISMDPRLFENLKWNDYLINRTIQKSMIAYHLSQKKNDGLEMVSFLVKIKSSWTSVRQLLWYTFIVIFLACLANFLFSLIPLFSNCPDVIYCGVK